MISIRSLSLTAGMVNKNGANKDFKDLSQAIDQLIIDIQKGIKYVKVYKQMKMYNDNSLNPILYNKKDGLK